MPAFTPAERRLIASLTTPHKVQRWLRALPYNRELGGETLRGFRGVARHRTAHCLEAALFSHGDARPIGPADQALFGLAVAVAAVVGAALAAVIVPVAPIGVVTLALRKRRARAEAAAARG